MTIYLTEQSLSLALRAIHRREVAATVREAQAIVNRAARAHRANAPRAGDASHEMGTPPHAVPSWRTFFRWFVRGRAQ